MTRRATLAPKPGQRKDFLGNSVISPPIGDYSVTNRCDGCNAAFEWESGEAGTGHYESGYAHYYGIVRAVLAKAERSATARARRRNTLPI